MEYIETGPNFAGQADIPSSKAAKQWFHQGSALTRSFSEAEKDPHKVFYLIKATGTGLTLAINDKAGAAKTVAAATTDLDFTACPLCLGRYGFAVGGTVNMIVGFYV